MQIAPRTGGPVPDVASLLARLAADGGRPRLTWYGDDGERVELSGAVLANWASKTVNLLVEEFDAAPGSRVVVDLPVHWRTAVWALASWRTGATVALPDAGTDPDVVVTDDPGRWAGTGADLVVVSLPALARRYDGDLPAGAIDAASAVMTYGDAIGWVPEVDPGQDALAGLAPSVRAVGDAYGPLIEAIEARRVVTFSYRAAYNGTVLTRHVEPWRIAARDGGWYLMCFDRDRQAPRVFRMSRIESRVRVTGPAGAYEIPDFDTDVMLGKAHGEVRAAVVAVRPERAGALRARAKAVPDSEREVYSERLPDPGGATAGDRAGWDILEVPYRSLSGMASEAAGYGAALVVLEPEAVRTETLRRLTAAAALGRPGVAEVSCG